MITQALSTRFSVRGRLSPKGFDKALRRWFPLCYLCVIAVCLTEPQILVVPNDLFHWHYWLRVAVIALAALTALKMDVLVIRRLHDSGRTGRWCIPVMAVQFLALVLIAMVTGLRADDPRWLVGNPIRPILPAWGMPYAILALAMLFLTPAVLYRLLERPGSPGDNRYGPRPC